MSAQIKDERGQSKKTRVLFIGEAVTLAHVTRLSVLAKGLNPEKYEVIFACDKQYRSLVDTSIFQFRSITSISPDLFLKRLGKGSPVYSMKELKEYVSSELALFEELSPDLVVGDFRISLGISADIAQIPYVTVTNAHWSPYSVLPSRTSGSEILWIKAKPTAVSANTTCHFSLSHSRL